MVWLHPDTKQIHIDHNFFEIRLDNEESIFYLLELLTARNTGFTDALDQRIFINPYGELIVKSYDKWINPKFSLDQSIGISYSLALDLTSYCIDRWIEKKN